MKNQSLDAATLRLVLILSLQFAAARSASSAPLCGDGESLATVTVGESRLVACGTKDGTTVSDLKIYGVHGEQNTTLFQSDDAFKIYRLETRKGAFHIQEALNSRRFKPFIEIVVSCDKDRCSESDAKCLWKKKPSHEGAMKKVAAAAQSHRCDGLDVLVDKAYLAMLNGEKEAVEFFEEDGAAAECLNADAAAGEAYMTYRDDIKRLRQVGCIPAASNRKAVSTE